MIFRLENPAYWQAGAKIPQRFKKIMPLNHGAKIELTGEVCDVEDKNC